MPSHSSETLARRCVTAGFLLSLCGLSGCFIPGSGWTLRSGFDFRTCKKPSIFTELVDTRWDEYNRSLEMNSLAALASQNPPPYGSTPVPDSNSSGGYNPLPPPPAKEPAPVPEAALQRVPQHQEPELMPGASNDSALYVPGKNRSQTQPAHYQEQPSARRPAQPSASPGKNGAAKTSPEINPGYSGSASSRNNRLEDAPDRASRLSPSVWGQDASTGNLKYVTPMSLRRSNRSLWLFSK